MISYEDFLKTKEYKIINYGFEADNLNNNLFDYQREIVRWALRKGKAALFEDTGLGKTIQQLAWADAVVKHQQELNGEGYVLILAPLAVSKQTAKEGLKFGISCNLVEEMDDVREGISITNYEKLHKFDVSIFDGVILDESSILKSYSGKTTKQIEDVFRNTKFKLCCTATPSPNDYTEIGTTAEFLDVMPRSEMLSTFFINDQIKKKGKTGRIGWRLKHHAERDFFRWMATWAMMIDSPSNLGFDGSAFDLPKLNINVVKLESDPDEDHLIPVLAETMTERRQARKDSMHERITATKSIAERKESCLIWCDFNYESEALTKAIDDSVEVTGSDKPEHKENAMMGFAENRIKYLISKPSICGFGMNWQNCHNMIFCGLSDSFEQFYQAVRRCYRFGQKKEVNVYIVISEREENIIENIKRKQSDHERMKEEMIKIMSEISINEINHHETIRNDYKAIEEMRMPMF